MKKSVLAAIGFTLLCSYSGFAQGITVFWDENYQGQSLVINGDWDASSNMNWNDQISSIRIPAGYKIQVFEHTNFGGQSKILNGDWTVGGPNFNDYISSIKILEYPVVAGRQHRGDHPKSKLCCDRTINVDGFLESSNKKYWLVLQQDRNFVLYKRTQGGDIPLWATSTNNNADRAVMQGDGNFVVYNGTRAVWASNTNGNPNASLVLQDDGNLVVYAADGRAIWASNTVQPNEVVVENNKLIGRALQIGGTLESLNGRFFLVLQNDRNLVLYMREGGSDKALWATATNNNADKAVMQDDGNFVVYNGQRATWASNTNGNMNASLVLQDDGNLVIYSKDGRAVWASNTVQASDAVVIVPVEQKTLPATSPCAMPDQQFHGAVHAIEAQSFKDGKMQMAKQATKNKCLSLHQIRTIGKLFAFEDQTLDFLKYAYDVTNSKDDYYTLADIFTFKSNSDNFMEFLNTK